MEKNKYFWLIGLVTLTLILSAISLLVAIWNKPQRPHDFRAEISEDILHSDPHLHSGTSAGTVLARVGDKVITRQELIEQFENLPPQMVVPLVTREDTLNFLNQYLGLELIYQNALKHGLDQDSAILAQTQESKKQFIIDKYLAMHLKIDSQPPASEEISQFYQANKSFLGNRKLSEVKDEISDNLLRQRQRLAYQELVDQLWQGGAVSIYEDSL